MLTDEAGGVIGKECGGFWGWSGHNGIPVNGIEAGEGAGRWRSGLRGGGDGITSE